MRAEIAVFVLNLSDVIFLRTAPHISGLYFGCQSWPTFWHNLHYITVWKQMLQSIRAGLFKINGNYAIFSTCPSIGAVCAIFLFIFVTNRPPTPPTFVQSVKQNQQRQTQLLSLESYIKLVKALLKNKTFLLLLCLQLCFR